MWSDEEARKTVEMQLIRLLNRQVCMLLIAIMWQKNTKNNMWQKLNAQKKTKKEKIYKIHNNKWLYRTYEQ